MFVNQRVGRHGFGAHAGEIIVDSESRYLAFDNGGAITCCRTSRRLNTIASPNLARVSSYALPANLIKKSVRELAELKSNKLTFIYFGLESGSGDILKRIRKGASPRAIVEGLGKARDAGLKVSFMVILGLGGRA